MLAGPPRSVHSITSSESPICELLGSAEVLVSTVTGVLDEKLREESIGDRISRAQLKILKLVRKAGTPTVGEVASSLGVSDAAASKTIDRIVRGRYLRRAERRSDRRSSELRLTPAGRKLLGDYESARARKLSRLFGSFASDDLLSAARFLERLTRAVFEDSNPREIGRDGTQNKTPARGQH